ncbi:RagB/SusD family nutrient uptake outer membrane protein [Chitinophaga defluvii]|uniref:RagB/SusD family nutrient uptake outer membrane protein n=1 Tax=Chitinophaga defluvii TaxID=3163343 RepID=A0ABV2T1E3_9BACT
MKKSIICLFLCFLVIGCKKNPLDITPDGKISMKDVFSDQVRTEAFLNTIYGFIPYYYTAYQEWSFLAGATDEAQDAEVGNNPGVVWDWITGRLTPSFDPLAAGVDGTVNQYPTFWSGIGYANIFLQNIDNATVKGEQFKSRLKGEAQLLRAFFYLELVKKYGAMPVADKPFDNDFNYTGLKRGTFQECVDFIVKDCDAVIANPNMPLRITIENERVRFSKAIAYAIKSEALLYNASPLWNPTNDAAKWQAAAAGSKEALTALTAGGNYKLADDYGNYFLNNADFAVVPRDRETIYERRSAFPGSVMNVPSKGGIWKLGACPSQELVDSYDMQATGEPAITGYEDADHLKPIINPASGYDPAKPYEGRDPRFYATVWYNGALYDNINGNVHTVATYAGGGDQLIKSPPNRTNTHTGYYLRKFLDPKLPTGQDQVSGWKKYRLAEIYLNLAEAENEANGPTAVALDAVNAIRRRAQMPDLGGLDKEALRERIRRERRVELAIEEHRFWDVRRWKILDKTDKLVTGMEVIKNPDNSFSYKRFVTERRNAWQDKFRIFPIPIADASIVPDFSENQNPGW